MDVSGLTSGVATVAVGAAHTCAVTSNGGVKCWGANSYGQLGDDTTTDHLTPVDVTGLTSGVTALAAGYDHTCALTSGGGLKCWGRNGTGQLGDGTTWWTRSTPVDVSGLTSGVVSVTAGGAHTCALTSGGGVKCWGYNSDGELGDGTTWWARSTPVDVSGLTSGVVAVAAGRTHACALTSSGGAKCWGDNSNGQLGDGTTTSRLTSVAVSGLPSGGTALAVGANHTCALTAAGAVECWGYNNYGNLGDGTTTDRLTPVEVSGLTGSGSGTAVSAGSFHTCALTSGGGVECWGANANGQLGDGTTAAHATPASVSGLTSGAMAVAAADEYTCALMSGGGVKCWGKNNYGQLGDGTRWVAAYVSVRGLSVVVATSAPAAKNSTRWSAVSATYSWPLLPSANPPAAASVPALVPPSCGVLGQMNRPDRRRGQPWCSSQRSGARGCSACRKLLAPTAVSSSTSCPAE